MNVNTLAKFFATHRQFTLYALIGATGATLDFIVFLILYNALHINPSVATTISVSLGIINNFLLNVIFNFKTRNHLFKRFLSFYTVGLLGVVLSIIIIYLGHNIIGLNANIAKLISIPVIVALQYSLNKHITFGVKGERLGTFVSRNKWLLILNVVFLFTLMFFMKYTTNLLSLPPIKRTPLAVAKQPPDESTHYTFNTDFILKNHRLPVSGKDDISALKACRNPEFGQVPCLYSYEVYPAPPYILSAIAAKLGSYAGLHPSMGARLPGLVYGLVMLNFMYLAAYRIMKRKSPAIFLTAALAFIPQVIYTLAYLNLDGFSLAIAALLTYATVRFCQEPTRRSVLWLGITLGGLLPLSKYSFFVLALPALAAIIYVWYTSLPHRKLTLQLILVSVVAFAVLSAFWYVRNIILYHDVLGQTYVVHEMAKYHPLGKALPLNLHSVGSLEQKEFIGVTFRSFFVAYGGMLYFISSGLLDILGFALFALGAFTLTRAIQTNDKRLILAWCVVVLTMLLALLQSMYNSITYDFQAQGRYMFPVLFPILAFLAYQYKRDKVAFTHLPLIMFVFTAYTFMLGLEMFARIYL